MRKARLALGVWIAWQGGALTMLLVPKLPVDFVLMILITAVVNLIGIILALAIAGLFK